MLSSDQSPGHVGSEARDRELGERQLTGIAGQHNDREEHQRYTDRDCESADPDRRGRRDEERCQHDAKGHTGPVDATTADRREPLEQVVAQRKRLAADHHPDDDDDKRHRVGDPGLGWKVLADLGLGDADRQAGYQGDREGAERSDERRRRGGKQKVGENLRLQRDDRDDQDRSESCQSTAERPVDRRDQIRGPAERGSRPLVLGDSARSKSKSRVSVEKPKPDGEERRDAEQDDAVGCDDDRAIDRPDVDRELARHEDRASGVVKDRDRLDRDQHPERGDHADERRHLPQGAHDDQVHKRAEHR